MGESENDWRLQGQERYLTGAQLVLRPYRQNPTNPDWDHDQCEFCWAKFSTDPVVGGLREGYATPDDYRWVCKPCFDDFQARFRWVVTSDA